MTEDPRRAFIQQSPRFESSLEEIKRMFEEKQQKLKLGATPEDLLHEEYDMRIQQIRAEMLSIVVTIIFTELIRRMEYIEIPSKRYTKNDMFSHGQMERVQKLKSHMEDLLKMMQYIFEPSD